MGDSGQSKSSIDDKFKEAKQVIQEWVDKQGHERCWYYPELFNQLVKIFDIHPSKDSALPPLEEFKLGCERYQREEYHIEDEGRWEGEGGAAPPYE